MVNVTLSVPDELKQSMDAHPELNWSEVARAAFKTKLSQLELLDALACKSKLTEKDALSIGRKINRSLWKKYKMLV